MSKYFNQTKSLVTLNQEFKALAKVFHPDRQGGNSDEMALISREKEEKELELSKPKMTIKKYVPQYMQETEPKKEKQTRVKFAKTEEELNIGLFSMFIIALLLFVLMGFTANIVAGIFTAIVAFVALSFSPKELGVFLNALVKKE